jgi:nitrogenase molybdenum-iron protein NifN
MAKVLTSKKACSINPLKMSQPIGAALAFMGLNGCMPVLHGSQGCTSFGLVLFVRHFRESIPLQTTAMNEVTTILGGMENIEQALLNINNRAKPEIIGLASTGLTETKGDDVAGYLKLIRAKRPELASLPIVYVSTPDFKDAFQDGWTKAVTAVIEALAEPQSSRVPGSVNVLVGSHLTPADIEELREAIESFGLRATFLPDLSGSLDGHVPDEFSPTTIGGTRVEEIRAMGAAQITIAVGNQMWSPALALEMKAGVPCVLFDRLTGLEANDKFFDYLSKLSGRPIALKYRRQRSQLVDAMLDAHFFFGGKKVAIGAEPDLLWSLSAWFAEMGCEIAAAVTTTHSPALENIPCEEVLIGDLEDLELCAKDADLLVTHSHGRQAAQRLGIPLFRAGIPCFDRLGAAHRLYVGYRGTRDLTFEIGNMFVASGPENHPDTWVGAENDNGPDTQARG